VVFSYKAYRNCGLFDHVQLQGLGNETLAAKADHAHTVTLTLWYADSVGGIHDGTSIALNERSCREGGRQSQQIRPYTYYWWAGVHLRVSNTAKTLKIWYKSGGDHLYLLYLTDFRSTDHHRGNAIGLETVTTSMKAAKMRSASMSTSSDASCRYTSRD